MEDGRARDPELELEDTVERQTTNELAKADLALANQAKTSTKAPPSFVTMFPN